MNGGTSMKQAHKMATCFVANVAGAPCVGEC